MSEGEVSEPQSDKSLNDYVEDGKNKMFIKCKFCGSKMLDKKSANYITQEKVMPLMLQSTDKTVKGVQSETLTEFYHVENMFTFENIGFTHTVDHYKYLSCADCDAGPVGYYDLNTKHSYVALSRIEHSN